MILLRIYCLCCNFVRSTLQIVCSNSRRSMPSQVDEETHQLSYLQKHMANILTLLAASSEGDGDESLVVTLGYTAFFPPPFFY